MKRDIDGPNNILHWMGNTPVHELHPGALLPRGAARVFVKLEEFNPGESIKARIALEMVLDAERQGRLSPGSQQTLIEPTGGNTGVGLTLVAAQRGYRTLLVVPDNYVSPTRLRLLKIRGAQICVSDHTKGNDSHVQMVRELLEANPDYVWLDQFSNPANPRVHYEQTGPELLRAVPRIDYFVAGIGSGGTITGVGRRLLDSSPDTRIIGVQPDGCDTLRGLAIPHRIQGLAVGMLPRVFDRSLVREMRSVTYEAAIEMVHALAKHEAMFVGISSGANIAAAIDVAKHIGSDATVATIAPDSGKNYPDVFLSDQPQS